MLAPRKPIDTTFIIEGDMAAEPEDKRQLLRQMKLDAEGKAQEAKDKVHQINQAK